MSTETMKSSPSTAVSSAAASGVEISGLPAIVTSALTWPSPSVAISSLRQATGSSPKTSARSLTRLVQRPMRTPLPTGPRPAELRCPSAARANIAPPSRSRLPVR